MVMPDSEITSSPERRSTGPVRWGVAAVLFALAAVIGVFALAALGFFRRSERALGDVSELVSRPQPTAVVQNRAVLLRELQQASELATAIYTLETIVDERQDRTLGALVIGQTRLLYVANGQVRAGVDLAGLNAGDLEVEAGTIHVRLPAPVILDQKIDVDRSYVYDVDRSILGPPDADLQTRAERYALEKIVRSACDGRILEAANARAELTVRTLLQSAGFDRVVVVTQPPGPCRAAATPVTPTVP